MEEEAVAHDRKLGFSLALCPGHPVIPQTLHTISAAILTAQNTAPHSSRHTLLC